jgi:flagellar motor switch protein FliN/FliY
VGASLPDEVVEVKIDFADGLSGSHSYYFSVDLATKIAGMMLGQEGVELDEMALSSLGEAVSNITGPTTTTIGNRISRVVQTEPASARRAAKAEAALPSEEYAVTAAYPFGLEGEEPAQLIEVFSARMAKELAEALGGQAAPEASQPQDMGAMFPGGQAGMQQTFGQALQGGGMTSQQSPPPNVQPVQFANLQSTNAPANQGNIGLLMDVFMEMTVELGRTKRDIKYILTIGEGTIIELDKLAGEPVDILVNNKLIAKGEVVVIDENFGVRVTEIVSPGERMADLT